MTSAGVQPDIVSSIWIARPAQDIWNYVFEVSTDAQWRDDVIEAQWTSDPPYGVGSTGQHIIKGIGDWPWVTITSVEPRIMGWRVSGGRFEGSHGAYRMEPEGDGSRFFMDTRFKRSIVLSVLMLVMKGRIKRQNAADLNNLKAILEGDNG